MRAAVADCLASHDAAAVAAVGLSTQRESLVLWERRIGHAVGPLLSWQDQRTAALRAAAPGGRRRPGACAERAPRRSHVLGAEGDLAARCCDPDRARSRRGELCLGTVDSWLLSRLGGEHVIEAGNASRTQLLDVKTCRWHPELLELFGIPESVLPTVVSSTGPFRPRRACRRCRTAPRSSR